MLINSKAHVFKGINLYYLGGCLPSDVFNQCRYLSIRSPDSTIPAPPFSSESKLTEFILAPAVDAAITVQSQYMRASACYTHQE